MSVENKEIIGKSGIYQIRNTVSEKIYVGSAKDLKARKRTHFSQLRTNQHPNNHLQNSYNKYNNEDFIFEVIEYVDDKEDLLEREQYWMDKLEVTNQNKGYNININAINRLGVKHTKESKMKMSINRKGKKVKEDNSFYGRHHSEETKLIISEKNRNSKKWLGENNNSAKLTEEKVIEIKKLIIESKIRLKEIAEMFNVCKSTISHIKNNRLWSHIIVEAN